MVEAFEERGLGLSMVMNHRFAPDNMRVHRAIQDGAIGDILMASVLHSSALTGNDDGSSSWRGRHGLRPEASSQRRRSTSSTCCSGSPGPPSP